MGEKLAKTGGKDVVKMVFDSLGVMQNQKFGILYDNNGEGRREWLKSWSKLGG